MAEIELRQVECLSGRRSDHFDRTLLVRNLNSHGIVSTFNQYVQGSLAAAKTSNPQLRDATSTPLTVKPVLLRAVQRESAEGSGHKFAC